MIYYIYIHCESCILIFNILTHMQNHKSNKTKNSIHKSDSYNTDMRWLSITENFNNSYASFWWHKITHIFNFSYETNFLMTESIPWMVQKISRIIKRGLQVPIFKILKIKFWITAEKCMNMLSTWLCKVFIVQAIILL